MLKYTLFLITLFGFFFAGCASDQTTTPDTSTSTSTVQLTYAGDRTGTFKVTGAFPSQNEGSGVSSTLASDKKSINIIGVEWTKKAESATFLTLTLTSKNAITEGQTFTFINSDSRAVATLNFDLDYPATSETNTYVASLLNVTLSTVKDNQIKGTFDGTFINAKGRIVTVSQGKIDVKY